ncbi:hypothetical protein B0H67DRAFT_193140 [Lasiosphaeris hirsuta]|uniref:Uncharacterized protein n=1 Tax=Lasiosphaeris hirsuta TaxID=260670 RepID=A0AA40E2S1_9PEZI|nr:hypothetical protein B0H67DRAFT_193140 [Lasiosphaeris hirsuta]
MRRAPARDPTSLSHHYDLRIPQLAPHSLQVNQPTGDTASNGRIESCLVSTLTVESACCIFESDSPYRHPEKCPPGIARVNCPFHRFTAAGIACTLPQPVYPKDSRVQQNSRSEGRTAGGTAGSPEPPSISGECAREGQVGPKAWNLLESGADRPFLLRDSTPLFLFGSRPALLRTRKQLKVLWCCGGPSAEPGATFLLDLPSWSYSSSSTTHDGFLLTRTLLTPHHLFHASSFPHPAVHLSHTLPLDNFPSFINLVGFDILP